VGSGCAWDCKMGKLGPPSCFIRLWFRVRVFYLVDQVESTLKGRHPFIILQHRGNLCRWYCTAGPAAFAVGAGEGV